MAMRADAYKVSTHERTSIGGIGLEWLIPIATICIPTFVLLALVGVPALYLSITFITAIVWGVIGFNYMHDAMHLKDFWMLKYPWLAKHFKQSRRLHDVHHVKISEEGRMQTNYGICFFFFDRLFGTYAPSVGRFNEDAYEAAKKRYSFVYGQDEKSNT
jgi:sterol desaturase/sphingolipid hydroxylase (fatty acid hydroxylase superfamily)